MKPSDEGGKMQVNPIIGPVTLEELGWLIDGLMVLMHGIAEVPENDGSELPGMQALLNRMTGLPGREAAWSEMATLGQELDPGPVVCVTHMRFVPCRRDHGCVITGDPADVQRVAACQRGTPGS